MNHMAGNVLLGIVMLASLVVLCVMAPLPMFYTLFFALPPALVFAIPLSETHLTAIAAARESMKSKPDKSPRAAFRKTMLSRAWPWLALWPAYFFLWEVICIITGGLRGDILGPAACLMIISVMEALCLLLAPRCTRLLTLVLITALAPPAFIVLVWYLSLMLLSTLAQARLYNPGYMSMGIVFGGPMLAAAIAFAMAPAALLWAWWRGDAWYAPRETAEPEMTVDRALAPQPEDSLSPEEAEHRKAIRQGKIFTAGMAVLFALAVCAAWALSGAKPGQSGNVTCLDIVTNVFGRPVTVTADAGRAYCCTTAQCSAMDTTRTSEKPAIVAFAQLAAEDRRDLAVSGNHLFLAGAEGLTVMDVSTPTAIRRAGGIRPPGRAPAAVAAAGNLACTVNWEIKWGSDVMPRVDGRPDLLEHTLTVMDVSNPADPRIVGALSTSHVWPALAGNPALDVAMAGPLVLCACGPAGLLIVDIANPAAPVLAGAYKDGDNFLHGVDIAGATAFVASSLKEGSSRLLILDLANPAQPNLLASFDTAGTARDVFVAGPLAYVTLGGAGLLIVDASNPRAPALREYYRPYTGGLMELFFDKVAVSGPFVFVDNRRGPKAGLHILKYLPKGTQERPRQAAAAPRQTPPNTHPAPPAITDEVDFFGKPLDAFAKEVIEKKGIAGQVVMAGQPVPGAKVVLRRISDKINDAAPDYSGVAAELDGAEWTADTDADGKFAFYGLEHGHYGLEAHTDKACGVDDMTVRTDGPPAPGQPAKPTYYAARGHMSIELRPAAPLAGRLIEKDGTPIAGAGLYPVQFRSGDATETVEPVPSVMLRQQTGPDGAFRFPRLFVGEWRMAIRQQGRPDQTSDWFATEGLPAGIRNNESSPHPVVKTAITDSATFRIADYKGKYVLLDFWATWCGPCRAEMPSVKAAYESFKNDPRLVMIGMSLDARPEDARKYITANGMGWSHVFLSEPSKTQILNHYKVEGIPCLILIDPAGNEVARDLRGSEIMSAVNKALGSSQ